VYICVYTLVCVKDELQSKTCDLEVPVWARRCVCVHMCVYTFVCKG
jgi:hypothetical protein